MKNLLLLLALLFCFSCGDNIKEKPINAYFNVDSLLNKQLEKLEVKDLLVKKAIAIDGETELDTVTFDSLGWRNELAVFRIADINKPNLKGLYSATEESSSDQIVWKYVTEKNSLGIEYLHIYFNKERQLKKMEALYNENNSLYTSKRSLSMVFNPKNSLLNSYKVEGSQKMILKEPTDFSIDSQILYEL